jgi:hypothetical protein
MIRKLTLYVLVLVWLLVDLIKLAFTESVSTYSTLGLISSQVGQRGGVTEESALTTLPFDLASATLWFVRCKQHPLTQRPKRSMFTLMEMIPHLTNHARVTFETRPFNIHYRTLALQGSDFKSHPVRPVITGIKIKGIRHQRTPYQCT